MHVSGWFMSSSVLQSAVREAHDEFRLCMNEIVTYKNGIISYSMRTAVSAIPYYKDDFSNFEILLQIFSWKNYASSIGGMRDSKESVKRCYLREFSEETLLPGADKIITSGQFKQRLPDKRSLNLQILNHVMTKKQLLKWMNHDWAMDARFNNNTEEAKIMRLHREYESYGNIWRPLKSISTSGHTDVVENRGRIFRNFNRYTRMIYPRDVCGRSLVSEIPGKTFIRLIIAYETKLDVTKRTCYVDHNRWAMFEDAKVDLANSVAKMCVPFCSSSNKIQFWEMVINTRDWIRNKRKAVVNGFIQLLRETASTENPMMVYDGQESVLEKKCMYEHKMKKSLNSEDKWNMKITQYYKTNSDADYNITLTTTCLETFNSLHFKSISCWGKVPLCPELTPLVIPLVFESHNRNAKKNLRRGRCRLLFSNDCAAMSSETKKVIKKQLEEHEIIEKHIPVRHVRQRHNSNKPNSDEQLGYLNTAVPNISATTTSTTATAPKNEQQTL